MMFFKKGINKASVTIHGSMTYTVNMKMAKAMDVRVLFSQFRMFLNANKENVWAIYSGLLNAKLFT